MYELISYRNSFQRQRCEYLNLYESYVKKKNRDEISPVIFD